MASCIRKISAQSASQSGGSRDACARRGENLETTTFVSKTLVAIRVAVNPGTGETNLQTKN
ncbi:MAG TPA: hypothetical protein DEB10_00435 [Ruminococcaceae bacterium]|nr:hypothetical protein [Oscillospiraceae bacterium]